MTWRRLAILQWVGLLVGAVTFTLAHLAGIGITQAACNAAGTRWGLSIPAWQGTVMGVSIASVLLAEVCAVLVFLRTRGIEFGDGPPEEGVKGERRPTRIHFFSAASIPANAIFLMIVILDGVADLANVACRQS
jgi:Na+/H+-translocating membrane pyrophosphatase